ncbi:MAG: class I SAM-dependent methyltransferase [Asgard group archaeon]|nr:class I SAM-dependent methyltransferase [Asgard group archaeon]
MTQENEWLAVPAPDEWMNGWDKYHKKLLEAKDEDLQEVIFISHPIQIVGTLVYKSEKKPLKALDLGCGDGRTACFLAKLGCEVEAIDALKSAVDVTNKRAKVMGLSDKVKAEQKNIDGWELKPESYDIIVAIQCIQYLFDRAIPRLKEISQAIIPGGVVAYSGNILPHFDTDPPIRFIVEEEIKEIFKGWINHSLGKEERLLRPNDRRGYLWTVEQKPDNKEEEKKE